MLYVNKSAYCLKNNKLDHVTECQAYSLRANGPELQYILNNFEGIPVRYNTTNITWGGEMANFILNNLKED